MKRDMRRKLGSRTGRPGNRPGVGSPSSSMRSREGFVADLNTIRMGRSRRRAKVATVTPITRSHRTAPMAKLNQKQGGMR